MGHTRSTVFANVSPNEADISVPSTPTRFCLEKCFAIQSGREVRIMVKPEDITDEGTKVLAKEVAKRIEKEMEYPGQIRVNVIRETRSTEFAK